MAIWLPWPLSARVAFHLNKTRHKPRRSTRSQEQGSMAWGRRRLGQPSVSPPVSTHLLLHGIRSTGITKFLCSDLDRNNEELQKRRTDRMIEWAIRAKQTDRGGDPRDPSVNFWFRGNSEFEEILRIGEVRDLENWGKLWARRWVQPVKRGSIATCASFFDRTAMFRPGTISKQSDTDAVGGHTRGEGAALVWLSGGVRWRAEFQNDGIQAPPIQR